MFRKDLFANAPAPQSFTYGSHQFNVPVRYRRLDCFFALFGADAREVKALLPSTRLRAIPIWPGRRLITLNAFNYHDTDIGPYGEFSVGVPCLLKTRTGATVSGVYVHRLPVTSELAKVAGLEVWGYPKFVCHMKFQSDALNHAVTLTQGDQLILELTVQKSGLSIGLPVSLNTFTVKDGQIVQTMIQSSSVVRLAPNGLAALKLGDHEMGLELKGLNLAPRPLATGDLLDATMLLPLGQDAGPVSRP